MSRRQLSPRRSRLQPTLAGFGAALITLTGLSPSSLGQPADASFAAPTIMVNMERDRLADPCASITMANLQRLPGGQVSLREAVCAANNSNTSEVIGFAQPGVYRLEIVGTGEDANETGDLDVVGALMIQHEGEGEVVIEAAFSGEQGESDRVLHVQVGGTLLLHGVTVRKGALDDVGGGILNQGKLDLVDVRVTGNRATHGGGLYNSGAASLRNSAFVQNVADNTVAIRGTGGGIANAVGGGLTAIGLEVADNVAYDGGGIGNVDGQIDVTGGRVVRNEAINNGGGAFNARRGSLALVDATIEQNSSGGAGGGIAAFGTLDVRRGEIAENRAGVTGGGVTVSGGFSQPTIARLDGVQLLRNHADGQHFPPFFLWVGGGAVSGFQADLRLSDAHVEGNEAAAQGGGIFARYGMLTVRRTTMAENEAAIGGGGVFAIDGGLDLANVEINDNRSGEYGGGIFVGGTNPQNRVEASVARSLVVGNRVVNGTPNVSGGGIAGAGALDLEIVETLIAGNSSNQQGGGVAVSLAASLAIDRSTFFENTSGSDGGALASRANSEVDISNSTLFGNVASGAGGAVDVVDGTALRLVHNTIVANLARSAGGGLNVRTLNPAELFSNLIAGNQAAAPGQEINVDPISAVAASSHNVLGHAGLQNAAAFVNFRPTANDILATADGTSPHDLVDIVETALASADKSTGAPNLPVQSPAIDNAHDRFCPPQDQRGNPRPRGAACDIGSVEYQ